MYVYMYVCKCVYCVCTVCVVCIFQILSIIVKINFNALYDKILKIDTVKNRF